MPYNAFSGQKKNTRKNLPGNRLQTILVKTNKGTSKPNIWDQSVKQCGLKIQHKYNNQ